MFASAVGWIGTAGTLGAYLLLSRGRLQATSTAYAFLNAVGGLLASGANMAFGAWPSAVSGLIWALISVRALTIALRRDGLQLAVQHAWRYRLEDALRAHVESRLSVRRSVDLL